MGTRCAVGYTKGFFFTEISSFISLFILNQKKSNIINVNILYFYLFNLI